MHGKPHITLDYLFIQCDWADDDDQPATSALSVDELPVAVSIPSPSVDDDSAKSHPQPPDGRRR